MRIKVTLISIMLVVAFTLVNYGLCLLFVTQAAFTYTDLIYCGLGFIVLGSVAAIVFSGSISRPFKKLEDDVIEITELRDGIEKALIEAREANAAKSVFLARMSHEMRTPLNAIIGLSGLTLEDETLSDDASLNLEKIYNAGATLLSNVNDLLDISKIEAGKYELIPAEYELPSIINDSVTQSIMYIGEKHIRFELNLDENLPIRLIGDDVRVKQILNNLLSNAFKYTSEGTVALSMRSEREGDSIWITASVRDTGIGIGSEDLDKIFDIYTQAQQRATRGIVGTGLGLPITVRLVKMMDGEITATSEPGKGSEFTVRYRQGFVTDETIGPEVVESLKNFHYSVRKRVDCQTHKRVSLPDARVLVVDDVMTNLDVARGLMKPYNMHIDCVLSGSEAIKSVADEHVRYDAIFMDYMMPELDGIETLKRIRALDTDYAKTVPIIALTADAIVGNQEKFLNEGFQAFLTKPIEIRKLDAIIREWIQRSCTGEECYVLEGSGNESAAEPAAPKHEMYSKHAGLIGNPPPFTISGSDILNLDGFEELNMEIDIARGIAHFDGDREAYCRVLRSFAANTKPLIEKVKAITDENCTDYSVTVHGVKGSSRGIFADALGNQAEALEKASKFVSANSSIFVDNAFRLVTGIENALSKMEGHKTKPRMARPDEYTLTRLLEACEHYDMDKADSAIRELEQYDYESGNELVCWLIENEKQVNFAEIVERLKETA